MGFAGIPTFARSIAYPDSEEQLVRLIELLDEKSIPFIIVGRMSNLLFKNRLYDGILIRTAEIDGKCVAEDLATLSCGASLRHVSASMAEQNLGGLEGLWDIPGTVGGMLRQNAGAFGYETSDRFVDAVCYLKKERAIRKLDKTKMLFSYRDSILSDKNFVLLNATFKFIPKSRCEILDEVNAYRMKRRQTQPIGKPSLGCVFKRYGGVGAGYYIDRAGLKGYSIGGVAISRKHAGFFINIGGATSDDFIRLVDYVKGAVYSQFGIELEEEIEIV
jgi:UDP-N-acetylmuramate dehydrogenase